MEQQQTDNKRIREIKGVVYLALALFLLLCLFSYHPQDPSFTRFVAPDGQTTHNFIGIFGSYIADSLIRLLGISSFLLPLVFLLCSFIYFFRPEFNIAANRFLGFFFLPFLLPDFCLFSSEKVLLFMENSFGQEAWLATRSSAFFSAILIPRELILFYFSFLSSP